VKTARRRTSSCLSPFFIAILILVFSCGCVAASAFALWRSAGDSAPLNVLILGLDRRPEQGYVVRSDVLMLMTAHSSSPRLALLSIPRDLYVDIPGYSESRINTAHFWGERDRDGGGPRLAIETVAANFGVPVHGYVRLDFDGFRAVVDAVGGVDVAVQETIVDYAYPTDDYGTTRIEIPAGSQRMDGETALRYVRTRHSSSDFDRAARQQQVLIALVKRLSSPETWPRLPALVRAVVTHVDTDLRPFALVRLVVTALQVGPGGIEHNVIGGEMTHPWTTPSGGAVLLPLWDVIDPLVDDLFRR
jgi:LCP family protein required for cell wall assembly